jgi:site-specific DNA recombinase
VRRTPAVPEALNSQVVCVYARFSNDQLQRDASIEDQVRTCTDAATANGWSVEPSLIISDAGVSGAQMSTREGIQTLLHRIQSDRTRTFQGVLFDDSSRLGRNLSEVLSFCKVCEFHQVFLYFVNQELDSRDPNFYQLMIQFASGDEQFLKKLKHAVTRGQKGRIAEGMIHGGRYYGYKTVAIADPTKRSTASKTAIKGVKLVIDEVAAAAVRAIFGWAEEGRSFRQIATDCSDANFPRPCTISGAAGVWTRDTVWRIVSNRLYCGFLTYGKKTTVKHPITGKIQMRRVPQSQWTIKHFPDLAIVTTEQWDRVRSIVDARKSLGIPRMAGSGRRDKSAPISLFSGLLFCDECGNPFVVSGKVERGGRFLKCKTFRYERQKCSCSLGIDEALLETRLVEHLVSRMLAHEPLESAIEYFHEALNAQILSAEENRRNAEASSATLLREQNRLRKERENIIASLRELGPIESLKSEFTRIEGRLKQLEDQLPRPHPRETRRVSLENARAFIHTQAHRLSEVLLADRTSARQAILRFVGPLRLRLDSEHYPPTFHVKGGLRICREKLP